MVTRRNNNMWRVRVYYTSGTWVYLPYKSKLVYSLNVAYRLLNQCNRELEQGLWTGVDSFSCSQA